MASFDDVLMGNMRGFRKEKGQPLDEPALRAQVAADVRDESEESSIEDLRQKYQQIRDYVAPGGELETQITELRQSAGQKLDDAADYFFGGEDVKGEPEFVTDLRESELRAIGMDPVGSIRRANRALDEMAEKAFEGDAEATRNLADIASFKDPSGFSDLLSATQSGRLAVSDPERRTSHLVDVGISGTAGLIQLAAAPLVGSLLSGAALKRAIRGDDAATGAGKISSDVRIQIPDSEIEKFLVQDIDLKTIEPSAKKQIEEFLSEQKEQTRRRIEKNQKKIDEQGLIDAVADAAEQSANSAVFQALNVPFFVKTQIKEYQQSLRIDPELKNPVFESEIEKVVTQKVPNKLGVDDVEKFLSGKGAKKSEIVDTKIPEFIENAKAAGKKSVTKDELIKHLDENKVQIEEVRLSTSPKEPPKELKDLRVEYQAAFDDIRDEATAVASKLTPNNVLDSVDRLRNSPTFFRGEYTDYIVDINKLEDFDNIPPDIKPFFDEITDLIDSGRSPYTWTLEEAALIIKARDAVNAKLADPEYARMVDQEYTKLDESMTARTHPDAPIGKFLEQHEDIKKSANILNSMPEAVTRLAALQEFESLPKTKRLRELYDIKRVKEDEFSGPGSKPQWEYYTVPGGEDYQEILLTVPTNIKVTDEFLDWYKQNDYSDEFVPFFERNKDYQKNRIEAYLRENPEKRASMGVKDDFTESHHRKIPNVMVHIRTKDRVDSKGRRILFVEEIQSDWHQKGRNSGYESKPKKLPDDLESAFNRRMEAQREAQAAQKRYSESLGEGNLSFEKMTALEAKVKASAKEQREAEKNFAEAIKRNDPDKQFNRSFLSPPTFYAQFGVGGFDTFRERWNIMTSGGPPVPDAPFKDTKDWTALSIKRIFREAAEGGYDGVAFSRSDMITPLVTLPENEALDVMGNPEAFLKRLAELKKQGGEVARGAEQAETVFGGNQYYYDKLIPSIAKRETKAKQGTTYIELRDVGFSKVGVPRTPGGPPRTQVMQTTLDRLVRKGDAIEVPFFELTDKVKDRVIKPQKLYSVALPGIAVGAAAAEEEELSAAAALGAIGLGGMALYRGSRLNKVVEGSDLVGVAKSRLKPIEGVPERGDKVDVGLGDLTVEGAIDAMRKIKSGTELAEFIAKNADNPTYKTIAKRIMPHLEDTDVHVLTGKAEDFPEFVVESAKKGDLDVSVFNSLALMTAHESRLRSVTQGLNWSSEGEAFNDVFIRGVVDQSGATAEVALHELVHAATVRRLRDGNLVANKGTKLEEASSAIIDLRNNVVEVARQQINSDEIDPDLRQLLVRATQDQKEFVAYGLTNRPFQEYLMTVKVGTKSAWTTFVEKVAELLGISKKDQNALSELLLQTEKLLDSPLDELSARPGTEFISRMEKPIQQLGKADEAAKGARVSDLEVPTETSAYEGRQTAGKVVFDSKDGMGAVPNNTNVAYMGFVAWMKPRDFLGLNPVRPTERAADTVKAVTEAIEDGKPIGPPFLKVGLVEEGDDAGSFRVVQHEGRARMTALDSIQPDVPVPVHVFGRGVIDRGRDITPEMMQSLVDPASNVRLLPDERAAGGKSVTPDAAWHVPDSDDYDPNYLPVGKTYRPNLADTPASAAAQTDTPEFKRFFGDSKVVDDDGKPLPVFHGTSGDFDEFRAGSPESAFGSAIYTSDNVDDVNVNYARAEGPDIQNRVDQEIDRIYSLDDADDDDILNAAQRYMDRTESTDTELLEAIKTGDVEKLKDELEPDLIEQIARQRVLGDEAFSVMKTYVKIENPVYLDPSGTKGRTTFDYDVEFDEVGNIVDESGSVIDLLETIDDVAGNFDTAPANVQNLKTFIIEELSASSRIGRTEQEVDAFDIFKEVKDGNYYFETEMGEDGTSEFIRQVFEQMGFDGIIADAYHFFGPRDGSTGFQKLGMEGVTPGTYHYMAFKPEQIKSATGNVGTFDPSGNILKGIGVGATIPAAAAVRSQRQEEEGNPNPDMTSEIDDIEVFSMFVNPKEMFASGRFSTLPAERIPSESPEIGDPNEPMKQVMSLDLSEIEDFRSTYRDRKQLADELLELMLMIEAEYRELPRDDQEGSQGMALREWYDDTGAKFKEAEGRLMALEQERGARGDDFFYDTSFYPIFDLDETRAFTIKGSRGPKIISDETIRALQEEEQRQRFEKTNTDGTAVVDLIGKNGPMNRYIFNKAKLFGHPLQSVQLNSSEKIRLKSDMSNVQDLNEAGLISFLLFKELIGDVELL